jgi:hypothetical protein
MTSAAQMLGGARRSGGLHPLHRVPASSQDQAVARWQPAGLRQARTHRPTGPANGFALVTATTLWDNRPARAVLRCLEFRAHASDGSEIRPYTPSAQPHKKTS